MANKRPRPEETVLKLRQVQVFTGQGMPRVGTICQIEVTEQTYYRWRKKYGGMHFGGITGKTTDRQGHTKCDLERFLSPAPRRSCIDHIRGKMKVPERRVCRVLGQHRSTQRRSPVGRADKERLVADMIELTRQYGRYALHGRFCETKSREWLLRKLQRTDARRIAERQDVLRAARSSNHHRRMDPFGILYARPCGQRKAL